MKAVNWLPGSDYPEVVYRFQLFKTFFYYVTCKFIIIWEQP